MRRGQVWKRKSGLSPPKLIPALVRYNDIRNQQLDRLAAAASTSSGSSSSAPEDLNWHIHYGIEYLEHCIEHQRSMPSDRAVYNYLLLLHASQRPLDDRHPQLHVGAFDPALAAAKLSSSSVASSV